jgi:hypothetical protein
MEVFGEFPHLDGKAVKRAGGSGFFSNLHHRTSARNSLLDNFRNRAAVRSVATRSGASNTEAQPKIVITQHQTLPVQSRFCR